MVIESVVGQCDENITLSNNTDKPKKNVKEGYGLERMVNTTYKTPVNT